MLFKIRYKASQRTFTPRTIHTVNGSHHKRYSDKDKDLKKGTVSDTIQVLYAPSASKAKFDESRRAQGVLNQTRDEKKLRQELPSVCQPTL